MTTRTFVTVALQLPQPPQEEAAALSLGARAAARVHKLQEVGVRAVESLSKRLSDAVVLILLVAGIVLVVVDIYRQVASMSECALTHGAPSLQRASAIVLRSEWEDGGEQ
jgi:hypothetical protein